MAYTRAGELGESKIREGLKKSGTQADARFSREGAAVSGSFIAAAIAAAAGGQALAPIFTLAALVAVLSPSRLTALAQAVTQVKVPLFLFGLFWLWLAASYFWSPQHNPKTLLAVLVYLPVLAVFVWVASGPSQSDREMVVRSGIACVLILAILTAQEGAFRFPFYSAERGPIDDAGKLISAQHTLGGAGAALTVLLWPAIASMDKKGGRLIWLAPILIALAVIVSRASRTSSILLALGVGGCCYLAARWRPRTMIVLSGIAVIEGLLAAPRLTKYLKYLPENFDRLAPASYVMRTEIWQNAAFLIAQKPLFGWGVDASKTFKQPYEYSGIGARDLIPWHPHNFALHLWLEIGLIGVGLTSALVLALTLSLVRGLGHDNKAAAGAVGGLGAFCVFAGVSFGAWQAWFLSSGFAAAALIAALVDRRERTLNAG